MMNLHSLMEISFSVRGYKCAAYVLLALAAVCFAAAWRIMKTKEV